MPTTPTAAQNPLLPVSELPEYPNGMAATRAWAEHHGWTGRKGGWIYNARGEAICQGWASLTGRLARHGAIRDLRGQSLATREGDRLNGRLRRNIFDQGPVLLDVTVR